MTVHVLLALVIITALAFDFTNGFHDTANAMATSIATGALPPKVAVALSAVLNVVGAFLSLAVANTIANGIVDQKAITLPIIFGGLVGAIVWNVATWYLGLPSSSSHALIGGVVGATAIAAGWSSVKGQGLVSKVVVPALVSPLIAMLVAGVGTFLAYRITHRTHAGTRDRGFRIGQIASASLVSLAHGTNDAQKTMGVITMALVADGTINARAGVPTWVIIACAAAIAAGTYLGGWRIIRTLGTRLVEVESPQGFAAESAAGTVLLVSSHFGYPLSTTHVASGAVLGSGVGKHLATVRWSLAARMLVGWLVTVPAAALIGALSWRVATAIGGTAGVAVMAAVAVVIVGGFWLLSRRSPVTHENVTEPYPVEPRVRVPASV